MRADLNDAGFLEQYLGFEFHLHGAIHLLPAPYLTYPSVHSTA
jgi:hypothetical protein